MSASETVMEFIRGEKKEKRELTQSQNMVSLAYDKNVQLWTDPSDSVPYVSVVITRHLLNLGMCPHCARRAEHWICVGALEHPDLQDCCPACDKVLGKFFGPADDVGATQ